MRQVLYHKHFAWNLIEDAIETEILRAPPPNSYWSRRRAEGVAEGWLCPENRRKSRELFVLFEQVLVPGELDVPLARLREEVEGNK